MKHAVHAEWTKLRTVPSTGWLLLATVACTVAVGALTIWSVATSGCSPTPGECDRDIPRLSLSGVYIGQVAVVVLAALAMTTEYDAGMIRTTLAANPLRRSVFAAKAAVVSAVVLAASLIGTAGSLTVSQVIVRGGGLPAADASLSLSDGPTRRAFFGTVLYLWLIGLLSLGLAAALRHAAGALATILGLLYVLPISAQFLTDEHVRELVLKYSPMTAGLAVQATEHLDGQPIGPWAGPGILAVYAGAAVLTGALLFATRDA